MMVRWGDEGDGGGEERRGEEEGWGGGEERREEVGRLGKYQ